MKKHKKKCYLFITDAGNGHRSCADSLREELQTHFPDMDIEIVNPYRQIFNSSGEQFYNQVIVKYNLLFTTGILIRFMKVFFAVIRYIMVKSLTNFFKKNPPDLVISLMPYINDSLRKSLDNINTAIPFCVVMTDWSDEYGMWIPPKSNFHIFCNTQAAYDALSMRNCLMSNVVLTSGMILKKGFYREATLEFPAKLLPDKFTVLLMYGIGSVKDTVHFLHKMSYLAYKVQFIVLCGNHRQLFEIIQSENFSVTVLTVPFTQNPAEYFRLAHLFVGKPGPGSLSEAMHMGLPVITSSNFNTIGQEKFNARYIADHHLGIVVRSLKKELPDAIAKFLEQDFYREITGSLIQQNNRAVFEITERLGRLL